MIGVKVDGLMVLVVAGIIAGVVVYTKRKNIIESVDPTNANNIVNQSATSIVKSVSNNKYQNVGDWVYKTKTYNPIAWAFEGIAKLNGDLP